MTIARSEPLTEHADGTCRRRDRIHMRAPVTRAFKRARGFPGLLAVLKVLVEPGWHFRRFAVNPLQQEHTQIVWKRCQLSEREESQVQILCGIDKTHCQIQAREEARTYIQQYYRRICIRSTCTVVWLWQVARILYYDSRLLSFPRSAA